MIRESRKISLLRKRADLKRAETRLENAKLAFRKELFAASRVDKASYRELGDIVGLSRQRIHQLIEGSGK